MSFEHGDKVHVEFDGYVVSTNAAANWMNVQPVGAGAMSISTVPYAPKPGDHVTVTKVLPPVPTKRGTLFKADLFRYGVHAGRTILLCAEDDGDVVYFDTEGVAYYSLDAAVGGLGAEVVEILWEPAK